MNAIKLSLILVLIFCAQGAFAQEGVDEPISTTCTHFGLAPVEGKACCAGLVTDASGLCIQETFNDPALTSCAGNGDCAGSTGCFPQRAKDLFSTDEDSPNRIALMEQVVEVEQPVPAGSACTHALDCSSYACTGGACVSKNVCRQADEGELATGAIQCGKDLVKNADGVCELTPEAQNAIFLGLLNEANAKTYGQCHFQVDDETKAKSIAAMKTLRAMEWLLASNGTDDCFRLAPFLENDVAKPFLKARQNILKNFSIGLAEIERDFKTLVDAKKGTSNQVEIHGQPMPEHDLATRLTSGYDSLMLMYRRNLLFQSYEQAMLKIVNDAHMKIGPLSEAMAKWSEGAGSWDFGTKTVSGFKCAAKYRKFNFKKIRWETKHYGSTLNRWTTFYDVKGSAAANADIVKKESISNYLASMAGIPVANVIKYFAPSKYFLMDPLIPEGLSTGSFGTNKNISTSSFEVAGPGSKPPAFKIGIREMRDARFLNGSGSGSYTAMHKAFQAKVIEFYKNIKIDKNQQNFVYEPELMTVEAKDCLDKPTNPKCEEFTAFLEEVTDHGFAQFLAYSAFYETRYNNYFHNATTWRRRLLTKYDVDMINISKYYKTVIDFRDKQNDCIEKVINQVSDQFLNGQGGLNEGSNKYYEGETYTADGKKVPVKKQTVKLTPSSRSQFSFDLAGDTLKNLLSGTNMDSIGLSKNTGSGSVRNSEITSAMVARADKMNKANAKAKASGLDVDSKEKVAAETLKSITMGVGQSMLASNAPSSGSSMSNSNRATLDAIKDGEASGKDDLGKGMDIKATDVKGFGMGGMSGADAGKGNSINSSSTESEVNQSYKDPTGMSDEEKDIMMANYERNRSKYQSSEDDGLFKILSKAYVRNLDKVLTKKKKEIED